MPLSNPQAYPFWLNIVCFVVAGAIVWAAGTRLAHGLDGIATHTRMGQAFVGMLLLGASLHCQRSPRSSARP